MLGVLNTDITNIDRTGTSLAESGLVVALTPAPSVTTTVMPKTQASTGNAVASGVEASNVVMNNSQALVSVGGANNGVVSILSSNVVDIKEGASAEALSGNAVAAPAGTAGPSLVTAPVGPVSTSVTTTGLNGQTDINLAGTPIVVTPNPSATGGLTIAQQGGVVIQNAGGASGVSGAACAGAGCLPTATPVPTATSNLPSTGTATTTTPSGTQTANTLAAATQGTAVTATASTAVALVVAASPTPTVGPAGASAQSGAASATGLTVQNQVTTNAAARVAVGGQNFGLISVVIDAVTEIINIGQAIAGSGSVSASNGGTVPEVPGVTTGGNAMASSGDANVTGAQVNNKVSESAAASVHVEGDNHNPITILIDLFAKITNFGFAWAGSGNAQASGSNGGTGQGWTGASSGNASATGLNALNQVDLSAYADVQIDGNNYADIVVRIRFHTIIENVGQAVALSGAAQAAGGPSGQAAESQETAAKTNKAKPTSGPLASAGSGAVGSGGSGVSSIEARSGSVMARGNVEALSYHNNQVANANGGSLSPSDYEAVHVLSLPTLPPMPTHGPDSDIEARSGDVVATGWNSQTIAMNNQYALCGNGGSSNPCIAANDASFTDNTHGDVAADSGFTGVNVTPTPIPTAAPVATKVTNTETGTERERGGSRARTTTRWTYNPMPVPPTPIPHLPNPYGYLMNVTVPSQFPGYALPPIPNLVFGPKKPASVPAQVAGMAPNPVPRQRASGPTGPTVSAQVNANLWSSQPNLMAPPMPQMPSMSAKSVAAPQMQNQPSPWLLPLLVLLLCLLLAAAVFASTKRGRRLALAWGQQGVAAFRVLLTLMSTFLVTLMLIIGLGGDR